MVANSLETQKTTLKFDSLALLREELGKQTTNPERLDEFQKTIDQALEAWDREGVIEFTEDEWKSLITNEDLPPIEQVKKLLQEKIEWRNEAKIESKEKREWIMGELDKKVDEVKKSVEDVKEKATGAVKEALSPIEKIKDGLEKAQKSLWEMWGNLWTPVKFAWYTLCASLGFKFGKDALAAMTKEKAEAVVEEAKKKVGEIGRKWEEKPKEEKEWSIEKAAPLALLGGAGLGIFALIKSKLPESITKNLNIADKAGFLKKLAWNRALKVFGMSGITLFGIGKLSEKLQDPKIAAELWEIPEDAEGKKVWWKKAIEKAGITMKDGAEEIWAIMNGEKLDEYLTSRENSDEMEKRGYVTLDQHPTILWAKYELSVFEKRCEVFYNQHREAFNGAVAAGLILKPGMVFSAGVKWSTLALSILQFASPGTIVPAGLVLGLAGNTIEGMKHIQVPKDFWPEDIKDMLDIPDIKSFLESQVPGITEEIHFDSVAKEFQTLEQKIKEFNAKSFWENIAKWAAEKIIESPQEKINSMNQQGVQTLASSLELLEKENKTSGAYKKLLWDDKEPGILKEITTKLGSGNALTEWDIRTMMEATEWTNIRIFPRDNTKSGTTIQWQSLDAQWNITGLPRNICVNPTLEYSKQFDTARDFVVDEYNLSTLSVFGKTAAETRTMLSQLTESIKNNNKKSWSLIESFVRNGWSIVTFGAETYAVDYLGNKYFLGPWNLVQSAFLNIDTPEGKLEMQEGLVEYGQGLAPIILITALWNKYLGHGFTWTKNRWFINGLMKNSIVQSVTYPLHIVKNIWKWGILSGKYIYQRAFAGDYKSAFSDPKNQIKAHFYETKHRMQSLQRFIPIDKLREIGGKHASIAKLEEARSLLYKSKQSWLREWDIKEAMSLLSHSSRKFEHEIIDNQSNTQIKELTEKIEKELTEQRNSLAAIENTFRERFPQELINRTATVESLKGFDISTPQGKKDAEKMLIEAQSEINAIEEERIKSDKDLLESKKASEAHPNDTTLRQDFDTKQEAHIKIMDKYATSHRELSEIREAMGELLHGRKPKIRLSEAHLRSVKGLRWSAKVLGVLALTVGAWFAIEKVAEYIHGDSHETEHKGTADEDDEKYYWFKRENQASHTEKKEKSEYTCETPEDFNKRIEAIETQYAESVNKFLDPEFIQNLSSEEREKRIQEAADSHMLRVGILKSLVKANRGMMEWYWNQHFTTDEMGEEVVPEDIRKQGVKAFMFIHRKEGKLTLDYMNHQDMKNVFYLLYDESHKNWAEKNLGNWVATAGDIALRVAPFTGSYMDGSDAYKSFSRGNVGDGLWSTAWCVGGLILDVGWVVSAGWTTAAWSALRAAKVAKTAGKALLHNWVQFGTQFGISLAKVPRSESISIDKL